MVRPRKKRVSKKASIVEFLSGVKDRPTAGLVILFSASIVGLATFTSAVSTIFSTLTDVSDRVRFSGVAKRYLRTGGEFIRLSQGFWIEKGDGTKFVFQEFRKSEDGYVYMYDTTRHFPSNPTAYLQVRIPIKGGMSQWSYLNPVSWVDLYPVRPDWTEEPQRDP